MSKASELLSMVEAKGVTVYVNGEKTTNVSDAEAALALAKKKLPAGAKITEMDIQSDGRIVFSYFPY